MEHSGSSILLVDDEAIIAQAKAQFLERHGFSVSVVHDGKAAIDAVVVEPFDLVLMDIDLGSGQMDGTDSARAILERRDVPILFISNHIEQSIVERTEQIVSYGYVVKSTGNAVLLNSINTAFHLFRVQQEIREHAESLATSEAKYRSIFEVDSDALFVSDVQTEKILEANPAAAELYRCTREFFVGMDVADLSGEPEATRSVLRSPDDQVGDVPERMCLTTEGTTFIATIRNRRFKVDGRSLNVAAVRNITDRKRARQALLLSEAFFSATFHRGPLLMTISEIKGGTFREVNERFVAVTGYRAEETIGKTSVEIGLIAPEDRDYVKREVVEKGRVEGIELELTRANGKPLFCLYHGELIKVNGQRKLLSLAIDITGENRALKAQSLLARELNHRVKNNILTVASMVRLKSKELGPGVDLSDILNQINAFVRVHEMLQSSESLSNVAIRKFIGEVLGVALSSRSGRPVTIVNNVADRYMRWRSALNVALVVNEIATNVVKHGFAGVAAPRITVELTEDPEESGMCTLSVCYNGSDPPAGLEEGAPSSYGLQLVNALVRQLRGAWDIERSPEPRFILRFPETLRENAENT